jgi:hypothetical protein
MRSLTARENAIIRLFQFIGVDHAILQITQTGLAKGYTDATIPFRQFLKRTGIHDYMLQRAGKKFIKYVDVFGFTTGEPQLLKVSFQRPATKGGRMFRISMLGSLRQPLQIQDADLLLFFVHENQLRLANLTQMTARLVEQKPLSFSSRTQQGSTIVTIAKNRILHVMEAMPECEPGVGNGTRPTEIAELSGMLLEKYPGRFVNALLDDLLFEQCIEISTKIPKKLRLCP